jgi:hypothetical protein
MVSDSMHDIITVGLPILVILFGILLNRADIKDLRAEINTRFDKFRDEINARFDAVDAELRYFHGLTGEIKGRIDSLEKRVS